MALTPRTRLGPYEILSPLGAGGMGEVYRARDGKLNRDVAIKILPEMFSADADRLARFKREAQVLASLNHPHIAAIYGFEDSSDTHALVLELVEGDTLADWIARGAIPLDDALPIARQIADALEAAHEQGIIHRDLKPANIKVTPDGKVKVLDFGLAKMLERETPVSSLSMSPTLSLQATYAGVILGTAAYMSPEQARGKPVDRRADIWAFGCVLFEMLAGRQTFETGETVSDAIAAILTKDPDWNALPPTTPPHIRALLRRCLQKDPHKRLPHIGVARLEIDEVPDEFPGANRPNEPAKKPPLWRRAIAFALTAIVAGAITAGIAYYARPSRVTPSVTRFSFALGQGEQFTPIGRQAVVISPDGTQMVYVANQRLWLRSMYDWVALEVPGTHITQGIANPVFSPDGRSLAFWSVADQTLKRIAVAGGAPVTICPASNPFGVNWGDDGILFGQGAGGIMRVSPDGGKPEPLIRPQDGEVTHGPQMLPGGDLLLFTVTTGTGANRWDTAHIVVQSLKSGERHTLIANGSDARYLSTGHIVYALGGVLYAVPLDLRRVQVTGGPVPVLEGVRRSNPQMSGSAQFSVANSGSLMFIPGPVLAGSAQQSALALFDGKGGAEALKLPPGSYASPRISPDGTHVAFGNEDGTERSVWIAELSGESSIRRLTFGGNNQNPIWSPDGRHVAFSSDREGDAAIFWQKADGTGTAERLTRPEKGTDHAPKSWSPDGKQFLFEAANGSSVSLWTLSLQDRKSTLLSGIASTGPLNAMFSPDGRWIVYQSDETGAVQVYVQPFPSTGAKYQITKSGGLKAVWSPDGKQIFYFPSASQLAVVTIATQPSLTSGNPVPLQRGWLEGLLTNPRVYDILPDGRRFIAVVPAGEPLPGTAATPEINVVLNWFEELKAKVPVGN